MHSVLREQVFAPDIAPAVAELVTVTTDVAPHGHAFIEVAVVLGGSATHVSPLVPQSLRRGAVVVLRPGEWHGYTDVSALSVLNVYVGPDLFARELAWVAEDPRLGIVFRPPRASRRLPSFGAAHLSDEPLRRLEAWSSQLGTSSTGLTDRTLRIAHLLMVIGEVAAAINVGEVMGTRPTDAHPAVVRAARLLQEDLANGWSVPQLAEAVNVAPAYLVRLFTRHIGVPPMAYLNRLRAERAGALLIESDLPVASIGAMVGWPDPSYASRRFRACFALSPAQYRAAFRPC